jgi:putative DNA primase/helicase
VYDAHAAAPTWERFIERVLPDAEVRDWLQRYLGYSLTGDCREQVIAFAFGAGANGKSVLLDTLLAIVGDYGLRAAPDLVLAKYGETHPTELADLEGRRIVVASEIEQGRAWAESTIKRITGDTTITARRMRQDFYTFPATHKIVVAANTKPTVRGTDHAIWRRMRLVPFEITIPEPERDKALVSRLLDERAGILAWLVRGCLAWQNAGLGEAAAMAAATEEYRADQDVLGTWIEEECVLVPGAFAAMSALYENYTSWCEATGRQPWTRDTVRTRLIERGLKERRTTIARGLDGIGIRASGHLEDRP